MRKLLVMLFVATAAFAGAARGQFCPGVAPWVFTDVLAGDAFCGYITWMAQTGVTQGCQVIDANNRLYCPDDLVTRKQMSAFMSRLGTDVTFAEGGNAFGTLPNDTAVLGTADGNALDVRVNGARVMRYEPNSISPNVIGGSPANNVTVGVRGATIAGGGVPIGNTDPYFASEAPNRVTDAYGTVGGGYANRAGNDAGDTVDAPWATVGGGYSNTASGYASTVGGGDGNTASGQFSTVSGGDGNSASGPLSTVGGGSSNSAAGPLSTVVGYRAITTWNATGSFVFSDSSGSMDFGSGQPNEFLVAATGGIGMWTQKDYNTGCRIPAGSGSWTCSSSRDIKRDFEAIDAGAVLSKVVALPITTWRYKTEDGARHLGPTAQDFHRAFNVGSDERSIATVDADGVALAAIQGLNAKLEAKVAAKDAEIAALKERLAKVETSHARDMADLRLAVEVLMARTSTEGRVAQTR